MNKFKAEKGLRMNIIIKIPHVVEKYAPYYEALFSEEGYEYFRRYLLLLWHFGMPVEIVFSFFVSDT